MSSIAAAQGPDGAAMAIGNAVGSVNCNIALIMAISLLFIPATFKRKDYAAKMVILLVAISALWTVSAVADKQVSWWEALIILAIFIAFMIENVLGAKKHSSPIMEAVEAPKPLENNTVLADGDNAQPNKGGVLIYYFKKQESKKIKLKKTGMVIERKDIVKNILLFILGAAAIVIGAQLMCDNAAMFAKKLKLSEALIGVTILASARPCRSLSQR